MPATVAAPPTSSKKRSFRRDPSKPKAEPKILFQDFFKSVGPRTYAAQVKEAGNGNHFLVLTEGKRDESGELRKTRLFVFSEDFPAFFRMIKASAEFIKAHPVSDEVKKKRDKFWSRNARGGAGAGSRTTRGGESNGGRPSRPRKRPMPRRKFTALATANVAGE